MQQKTNFARGLSFYKLFWIFTIGCVAGVVLENIWYLLAFHRITNRVGLVYGPFNPIYGMGALVITVGLYWLRDKHWLWIFFGGVVLGSAFEYICSWVHEAVFGTVSWNYSHLPLNINGRINLVFSLFWGFVALLWTRFLYPGLSNLIERIPHRVGIVLTWTLFAFLVYDILVSAAAVGRMSARHVGKPAANRVEAYLDEQFPDERLHEIYPSMKFVDTTK